MPNISFRKSDATMGIWLTSGEWAMVAGAEVVEIRGAIGALIQSERKLSRPCTNFGILKSNTFGYGDRCNDFSDAVVPNVPVFIFWNKRVSS